MRVHTLSPRRWALRSALAITCSLELAACGGGVDALAAETPSSAAATTSALSLWGADGRPRAAADPAASTADPESGQRYATREQLAFEENVVAPYTLIIDADDEAAVASGLQLADTVHAHAGGKTLLGVFVRSPQPALAERLAARLAREQGWEHVFVVR
jgi:hypothetical protein